MGQESLDRATTQKAVAIAVAGTVLLIAALLAVMSVSYADAVSSQQAVTRAHDRQRHVQRAEKFFWREREAMNEYLLTPTTEIYQEVQGLERHFNQTLRMLRADATTPQQQERVGAVTAAHEAVVRAFEQQRKKARRHSSEENSVVELLADLEPPLVRPLDAIAPLNGHEEAAHNAAGHAATRRALVAGILAAILAIGGGTAFSLYAFGLIGRIRAQNAKLKAYDKLKDDFVASVSHELRTPLTSIRGYVELLLTGEGGDLTDEQERFLTVVDRNADRLLSVVGDLLFVSQVEAGVTSLEPRLIELVGLVKESVDAARPAADAKGINLELTAGVVAVVEADRLRLAQVFDNLLSNAIKFTPAGGRVAVRVLAVGKRAVVEVSDSGMGISAEDQLLLFTRFFRSAAANQRAIQGTGLGLAITKAIVDSHGGAIRVRSDVGQGATFSVELPLGVRQAVAA
jgi:signal transduction histidine kinase